VGGPWRTRTFDPCASCFLMASADVATGCHVLLTWTYASGVVPGRPPASNPVATAVATVLTVRDCPHGRDEVCGSTADRDGAHQPAARTRSLNKTL